MTEVILPLLASKYSGHIWQTDSGYRLGFSSIDKKRHTKRFATYEDAFNYLKLLNECENNVRVKNIIQKDKLKDFYTVSMTKNRVMLFDEIDLPLVQAHIWFMHNKGYIHCTKKDELPSTLFHVCATGPIDNACEIKHLNKQKHDNRRCNIPVSKRTRVYCGKRKRTD